MRAGKEYLLKNFVDKNNKRIYNMFMIKEGGYGL